MTPATAKNLRALVDRRVVIEWADEDSDWPHFTLIDLCPEDNTIFLRGESYPDGSGKHKGDSFWADWSDIDSIKPLDQS
jgi:hypothetical protein